jgi:hypothetical protein
VLSLSYPPSFRVVKAAVAVTRPPRVRRCRGTPPIFLPLLFKVEDGETTTNDVDAFRAADAMTTSRDAALLFFFALKSGEAAALVDDAKTVDMRCFFFALRVFYSKRESTQDKFIFFSLSNSSTRRAIRTNTPPSRGDERETELFSLSLFLSRNRRRGGKSVSGPIKGRA